MPSKTCSNNAGGSFSGPFSSAASLVIFSPHFGPISGALSRGLLILKQQASTSSCVESKGKESVVCGCLLAFVRLREMHAGGRLILAVRVTLRAL